MSVTDSPDQTPMTDRTTAAIVRELRERVVGHPRLLTAAADEIERLERERDEMSALALRDGREVERLRAVLLSYVREGSKCAASGEPPCPTGRACGCRVEIEEAIRNV